MHVERRGKPAPEGVRLEDQEQERKIDHKGHGCQLPRQAQT